MIAPSDQPPTLTNEVTATVCHLADTPLTAGDRVLLRHGTRTVTAKVKAIDSRLTLADLSQQPGPGRLVVNDIGEVVLRTAEPVPVDDYAASRRTGSFILIDPADGAMLTAGMAAHTLG